MCLSFLYLFIFICFACILIYLLQQTTRLSFINNIQTIKDNMKKEDITTEMNNETTTKSKTMNNYLAYLPNINLFIDTRRQDFEKTIVLKFILFMVRAWL